ncbi:MAG: hypothetical protein DRP42_06495 [Tenericutes bacterium]|nr:MAG: hypothetical protein DRP42_06495 [Mycoplasmatota bacterium]
MTLKMLYGDTKELIVFKANEADQKKAMELLELSLEEFQKEKRMIDNDPEIVDVKTFDDVPKEFFSEEEKKTGTGSTGDYSYGNVYGAGCGHTNSTWAEKEAERKKQKDLEDKLRQIPTLIKRGAKDGLPSVKVMNAMKKKVTAITSGDYECDLVDPDPEDTFVEKKSSTVG